jgi:hypothetical protein
MRQIVSRAGEREDPVHLANSTMPKLAHQRNRLQPAEVPFDSLPLSLIGGITGVSRRALIDRAAATPFVVLRHMWRHIDIPILGHESLVPNLFSPPTVTGRVPANCSDMTSAASRSGVPLAWKTSAPTIRPLRFSTNKFRQ